MKDPQFDTVVVNKTVYRVVTNSDLIEGRGNAITLGWFLEHEDAVTASKGQGVFGSDAKIEEHQKPIVIVDGDAHKWFLLGEQVIVTYEDPRVVKARALAKLTAKERKALGFE